MASRTSILKYFSLLICALAIVEMSLAAGPDILADFIAPPNGTVDRNFFTFTSMRILVGGEEPKAFRLLKTIMTEFLSLNGQSVSYAFLEFPPSSTNPPHTHPYSAELLFLVGTSLEVGFVDTKNNLFTQILQAGDLFVFPKGLVHYQYNSDSQESALAISAFGSVNAETVSLPTILFSTNINDNVFALSFKTDVATIQKLKANLAPKT